MLSTASNYSLLILNSLWSLLTINLNLLISHCLLKLIYSDIEPYRDVGRRSEYCANYNGTTCLKTHSGGLLSTLNANSQKMHFGVLFPASVVREVQSLVYVLCCLRVTHKLLVCKTK